MVRIFIDCRPLKPHNLTGAVRFCRRADSAAGSAISMATAGSIFLGFDIGHDRGNGCCYFLSLLGSLVPLVHL